MPSLTSRCTWTQQEDLKLKELVETYGSKNWAVIASQLDGRIGKQCRERWRNHLDPHIRRDRFSDSEDKRILSLVAKLGTKWARISELMEGRTENALKNRYYCFLNKKPRGSTVASRETSMVRTASKIAKRKRKPAKPVVEAPRRQRPVRQAVKTAKALQHCWLDESEEEEELFLSHSSESPSPSPVHMLDDDHSDHSDHSDSHSVGLPMSLLIQPSPELEPTAAALPTLRDMLDHPQPSRERKNSHTLSVISNSDDECKDVQDEDLFAAYVLCDLAKAFA